MIRVRHFHILLPCRLPSLAKFPLLPFFIILLFSVCTIAVSQQGNYLPKSKKENEQEKLQFQKERKRIISSRIYSVTTTKHPYKFGKPDKKGSVESVIRYNSNGDKTEEINYNQIDGSVRTRTTYRYNAKGQLIEEILTKDDNSYKTVHRYNGSGKTIETVQYNANGSVDKKNTFIYDSHGLLLETIGYLDDGRIFQRDSYFYDTNGNVIEFRSNLNKFLYSYDLSGNVVSLEKYIRYFQVVDSVHFILADRYMFDYDRSGYLIEMVHQKSDSTMKSRIQYNVNRSGQLMEEKEYNGEGRVLFTRKVRYNKEGNIVEEVGYEAGRKFKNIYNYDSRDNKTEWISYDQINEPLVSTKYSYNRYSAKQSASENTPSANESSDEALTLDKETTEEYYQLLGGRIVAPDGGYLGMIIADTLDSQSIANAWGQYGYEESPTSIFNPSIPYGGTSGVFSPFNPNSPSPPSIYKDGKFFSYLTENENFRPRSSPKKLILFLKSIARMNR